TDEAVEALRRVLAALDSAPLRSRLPELLTVAEVDATRRRVELMLKHRIHPYPSEDWPAVPWPPM
ncbi:MAG TPA: phosphatidylinositol kinase, partial [Streptosporangiaceae bacterium]|nr:phosphatidylinositol kinase [Streptosporangiaceae bacterium]